MPKNPLHIIFINGSLKGAYWVDSRPRNMLLGGIAKQGEPVTLFIRDLMKNTQDEVLAFDPITGSMRQESKDLLIMVEEALKA